jgi:hypothetical protein
MSTQFLSYQKSTDTIRQLPENYCIAYKINNRWICDPDIAANRDLSNKVFNVLFEHEFRYGDGLKLLSKVMKKEL